MNKSIFIIGAIALFASASYLFTTSTSTGPMTQSRMDELFIAKWAAYKKEFSKSYQTKEEEVYRMNVFLENLRKIESHNSTMYQVGVNGFSDLTTDEFVSTYLGFKPTIKRTYLNSTINGFTASNVNWTAAGAVQPVQNQGQCGSCWAFSAIGSIESSFFVNKNGTRVKLSEEQLVECSSKYGNGGCQGGLMDNAFEYAEQHPLCTEDDYPYTSRFGLVGVCKFLKVKKCTTYKVTGYVDIPQSNCTSLYNGLVLQPVSVAVDATNWQSYKSGVFPSSGCQAELNHGVLLTGFVATGTTPYWVIRNSWGTSWGNNGYINLEQGNTCGVCDAASYPNV